MLSCRCGYKIGGYLSKMALLNKLNIHNLRNITDASILLATRYNFFYGNNGSGKTSILEAIYLLANGKSFRSHLKKHIIAHQQQELTIFAEAQLNQEEKNTKFGFTKGVSSKAALKIEGEYCRSLTKAAKLLPVLRIDPTSYGLLEQGPKERRHYLDWGVFHVEPTFGEIATNFQRCLKQRNAALKRRRSRAECQTWDIELSALADQLTTLRTHHFQQLRPSFGQLLAKLALNLSIDSQYYRGWQAGLSLQQALEINFEKDFSVGYTSVGPQKADIRYTINSIPAEDVLSRGQMKLVVSAMQFSQGILYAAHTKNSAIYLIDDLASELDDQNRGKLFGILNDINGQFLITATNKAVFSSLSTTNKAVFHVEQGTVVADEIK